MRLIRRIYRMSRCRVTLAPTLVFFFTSVLSLLVWEGGAGVGVAAKKPSSPVTQPTWVVDPAEPGADTPPVGRSLFDQVASRQERTGSVYDIPFPFTALLTHIEEKAGHTDASSRFKVLLVPFGRSLHRYAADPDFLHFPRMLAAIDTEPRLTGSETSVAPFFLKNRLFLGYQEQAGIIEIISFNEAAGRFEFQIVRNYFPGKTPHVVYANRKICTVCHQNQAPIFSEPLWHETNAHPLIHKLLEDAGLEFSSIQHGVDVGESFDTATDQANDMLVAQHLWKEGCEIGGSVRQSVECRATLFISALQQRLSGRSVIRPPSVSRPGCTFSTLATIYNTRWPDGLSIPNPNLPNRPLPEVLAFLAPQVYHTYDLSYPDVDGMPMHPLFDPITPRPPLAIWTFDLDDTGDLHSWMRYLTALADAFALSDLHALNDLLINEGRRIHLPAKLFHSNCQTGLHPKMATRVDLHLKCGPSSHAHYAQEPTLQLEGRVVFENGRFQNGTLSHLRLAQEEQHFHPQISHASFQKSGAEESMTFEIRQTPSALPARTVTGNRLQSVKVTWSPPFSSAFSSEGQLRSGHATLRILEDFSLVEQAVEKLVRETIQGDHDLLGATSFRRMDLLKALFRHVQAPDHLPCCERSSPLPPIVLDAHSSPGHIHAQSHASAAPLQLIERYCGDCHHGEDPAPPNFLHGSISEVEKNVNHCAERMYARLTMWERTSDNRQLSPMPPPTALPRLTAIPSSWPQQKEFRILKGYLRTLIEQKHGAPSEVSLAPQHYWALPGCLPLSGTQVSHSSYP